MNSVSIQEQVSFSKYFLHNNKIKSYFIDLGVRPVIIRSEEEVDVNKWTTISLGRRHGEGFIKVGDSQQVTGKTVGPARSMYLKTHLYIGGYDKRILLNKAVGVERGFDGCVSGVSIF